MSPLEFLGIRDSGDSLVVQAALQAAEENINKLLDDLAVKIRNQIVDAFKS
jgi:hypothetical protein